MAGLVSAALYILAGQSGARRAETRLLARLDALEAKASEFAGRERARRPETATGSGSFDGWALLPASGAAEGDGPLGTQLGKIAVPEKGLRAFVQDGEKSFLLVARRTKAGTLFLYRSADATLEDELSTEAGLNVRFGLGKTEATAEATASQVEGTKGRVTITSPGRDDARLVAQHGRAEGASPSRSPVRATAGSSSGSCRSTSRSSTRRPGRRRRTKGPPSS